MEGGLLPALRAGELDLVLGLLPARPLGAEYVTERLYDDPTVTVVRQNHPLTRIPKVSWQDLADYPMVLPPQGSIVRGAIDRFMAEHRVNVPRRHLESVSTLTNLGVLQLTDSVAFWQLSLGRHFANQGALSLLGLALPGVIASVGLIWMADRRVPHGPRLVLDLLRNLAAEVSREWGS
jgi:DNA-binding transcriptional LysR family regulator